MSGCARSRRTLSLQPACALEQVAADVFEPMLGVPASSCLMRWPDVHSWALDVPRPQDSIVRLASLLAL
eukprot:6388064-Alexandrium_andersonii.AAC.1